MSPSQWLWKLWLAAIAIVFFGGCSTLNGADRVTSELATHSYQLRGQGSPVVILEAGLGDGKESWAPVFERISRTATVFAYDRVGYGSSRSKNESRDGATIVAELRATLRSMKLDPPFVLVGHSIGGTYVELFARTYPDDVAGVVLVDSRHADFDRQCRAAGARMCDPPAILGAMLPQGPKRELAGGDRTMQAVMTAGPFPDVPLTVLSSPNKFFEGRQFRNVWMATQESLATLSSKSRYVICERCGHYIHRDNPKLVTDSVIDMVELIRGERAR
jgi:pimeloyl-ACP methyl ester carboxylesterase